MHIPLTSFINYNVIKLFINRFHGEGTLYFSNGSKYKGTWENGKCVEVFFNFISFRDSKV